MLVLVYFPCGICWCCHTTRGWLLFLFSLVPHCVAMAKAHSHQVDPHPPANWQQDVNAFVVQMMPPCHTGWFCLFLLFGHLQCAAKEVPPDSLQSAVFLAVQRHWCLHSALQCHKGWSFFLFLWLLSDVYTCYFIPMEKCSCSLVIQVLYRLIVVFLYFITCNSA